MKKLQNDLLLRALAKEKLPRPPVWMMRQAGRYLPEYRKVRANSDFFSMVRTPELACEVTLQPIRRFGLDAAIIFSDILVIPQALGCEVVMDEGKGPQFLTTISEPQEVKQLRVPEVSKDLGYVFQAIRQTVSALEGQVPLIGFAGAPWTLFAYMTNGSGKSFSKAKKFLFSHPQAAKELFLRLSEVTAEYLLAQIEAGADVVQIFDSWAGELGPDDYKRWALPAIASIVEKVVPKAPVIVFAKGAHYALEDLAATGATALGLDWTISPEEARTRVPHVVLQGNLDPSTLYASPQEIRTKTINMMKAFGTQGYICNLGHGIYPDIDPNHVEAFVKAVKT